MIPALIEQLNKPHALFHQSPSQQTVVREARCTRLGSISLQRRSPFVFDFHQLRYARLHPVRQLILRDSRGDFRVTYVRQRGFVEKINPINNVPATARVDALRVGQK